MLGLMVHCNNTSDISEKLIDSPLAQNDNLNVALSFGGDPMANRYLNLLRVLSSFALVIFVSAAARADNIVLNQWYEFGFGLASDGITPTSAPGPISSIAPFYTIPYNAPSPGGPTVIPIPAGDSWTITLASPGYLVVTDVERAGDVISMFLNGSPLGTTSTPCPAQSIGCDYNPGDLTAILANPNFSNGEFALPAGVDTITGTWLGYVGTGDGALVVSSQVLPCQDCGPAPTPLPAALPLFASGLGALGLLGWRRKRKATAAA